MFVRNNTDLFKQLQDTYGHDTYTNSEKIHKAKNTLVRHIHSCGNYRKIIKDIIKEALRYHEGMCKECSLLSDPKDSIGAVVIAAHLCHKYTIDDKDLVKRTATAIFRADGGFDRFYAFMDPLTFPYELDLLLYPLPWDMSMEDQRDTYTAILEYFLSHGMHEILVKVQFGELDLTRSTMPYHSYSVQVPSVDAPLPTCRGSTPLLLACHAVEPANILLLLRYGAEPLKPGQNQIIGLQFQHPLYVLTVKLNSAVFWMSRNQHVDPNVLTQFLASQEKQIEHLGICLRYFCRAVRHLPIRLSTEAPSSGKDAKFHLHPQHAGLVPAERISSPAELEHQCRCAVRDVLRAKRRLPEGIYKLPIPSLLHKYLDLLRD